MNTQPTSVPSMETAPVSCPASTVFIVDDDPGIRKSLQLVMAAAVLPSETFASAEEFLQACLPDRPGCLLLDLRMPGMSGQELLEILHLRRVPLPVIVITGHADIPAAVHMFKLGAVDFLQKPVEHRLLVEAVRKALAADARRRVRVAERAGIAARLALLSPRQRALVDLLVTGKSNKEIAGLWNISLKTVMHHRAHVMAKVQAVNTADLVRMVVMAEQPE